MEELLPSLKNLLKEAIEINLDASNLAVRLIIKPEIDGVIAKPEEIIVMLKMYGGLKEDIPMKIEINNETQNITLTLQNDDDYKKISKIFESIWDSAVDLLNQAIESDFSRIKNIPNIDD